MTPDEARRELRRQRWRTVMIFAAGWFFVRVGGWGGWLIAGVCFGVTAVSLAFLLILGRLVLLLAELEQRVEERRELDESLRRWFRF